MVLVFIIATAVGIGVIAATVFFRPAEPPKGIDLNVPNNNIYFKNENEEISSSGEVKRVIIDVFTDSNIRQANQEETINNLENKSLTLKRSLLKNHKN